MFEEPERLSVAEELMLIEQSDKEQKNIELSRIILDPDRHKPLENPPKYTGIQKKILSFILSFMATIEVSQYEKQYIPRVYLRSHNFQALWRLHQLMRLGKIGNVRIRRPPYKTTKQLQITDFNEIIFLLEQIKLKGQREKKLAELTVQFCKTQNPKIAEQIEKLNAKPRLKPYQLLQLHLEEELGDRRRLRRYKQREREF